MRLWGLKARRRAGRTWDCGPAEGSEDLGRRLARTRVGDGQVPRGEAAGAADRNDVGMERGPTAFAVEAAVVLCSRAHHEVSLTTGVLGQTGRDAGRKVRTQTMVPCLH